MCVCLSRGRELTERRLHVSELPADGGEVTLDEAASRHVRVWRLRTGDPIVLFDGRGNESSGQVLSLDERVICIVQRPTRTQSRGARLVLVLGVPKGGKLDECVRMATELGVHEIALLQAERSLPRWDERRARSRIERLTRIAAEAAAQCERSDLPTIHPPRALGDVLSDVPASAATVVFGARAEGAFTLPELPEQVWCAVGPEGGFSDAEGQQFESAGFTFASLGPTVLRVDTAVAAALAIVGDRVHGLQAR